MGEHISAMGDLGWPDVQIEADPDSK